MKSNIELIGEVDKFAYSDETSARLQQKQETLWTLLWRDDEGFYPVGYILDRVLAELQAAPQDVRGPLTWDKRARTIRLLEGVEPEAERTQQIAKLTGYWRQKETFPLLKGWRNELWPVYGRKGELLFSMERTAVGLLGAMRYGVHMIAYIKDDSAPYGIRFWVPRRAANKSTFPGMLDNTVAGGLATGEDPFECLIREADEEADLPGNVVRSRAKHVDVVTYMYITEKERVGEADYIYPECQWVYDLELPIDVIPQPKDGEVEEFCLCDVSEVKAQLAAGEYKPNCALVVIAFFIRHGILTKENEPDLVSIEKRIHRDLPFPGPHKVSSFKW
ncbi:uncharacterized protein J7T54_000848 [Emericellopsis cladophorae]|uniref:Nudix hydrolase domain-containing protein n=1 Tax=Emericellopsis cladophorae TaxID=2686198 RepID=A0A9Q0BFI6_9HYPO|nr:uncharacterized protein J7T54_000848 [Emericellopsis cladophorae]KAI6782705.1 hypothetical protein J7T54_000848 [Emericellopsis cladophorae]